MLLLYQQYTPIVKQVQDLTTIIHPHQRCGYSDLPFAKKHTFLYCRVQKWVGGVDNRGTNKLYLRKDTFLLQKNMVRTSDRRKKTSRICWKR